MLAIAVKGKMKGIGDIMFDEFYTCVMGRRIAPEKRRDYQVGFRTTHANGQRLEALIARILADNSRVEKTEIYEELMGLKTQEFISAADRDFLSGLRKTLPESDQMPGNRTVLLKASTQKSIGRGKVHD